jgi:N6-adenosine-specific RNA methylase IME4
MSLPAEVVKTQITGIATSAKKADLLDTLSIAKQLLAETRDFTTILNIHDKAVAAQAWAKARNADEVAMQAVEVKLRAEHKAGEFLQEMKKEGILSKGGRKAYSANRGQDVSSDKPTLPSLGVEQKESSRWQRIANIPEAEFEEWLALAKKRTQSALLALAMYRKHADAGPMPTGDFDVILADPPWQYEFSISDRGDPENQYDTMTVDEIVNLSIPSSEHAVLFLWATNPKLPEALGVMNRWGFVYRTNMVWNKKEIGTGYYVRGQHELLLIGVKGDTHPPEENARPPSVLEVSRRGHSQKPDEIYGIIEHMYPNSKRLELFARNSRDGWTSWGG